MDCEDGTASVNVTDNENLQRMDDFALIITAFHVPPGVGDITEPQDLHYLLAAGGDTHNYAHNNNYLHGC